MIYPTYAEEFSCIGSSCCDSCCIGWNVEIDQNTYDKYQTIPAGPLRSLIDGCIRRTPDHPDGSKASAFATIEMSPLIRCPMHNAEGLCQIQVEHGVTFLSWTCSTYPRAECTLDYIKLKTLSLSCPEAARLVLTNPELTNANCSDAPYVTWEDDPRKYRTLLHFFWPIREFTVTLVKNRSYPLWQRMFLLGNFCRRLEAVIRNEVEGGYSAMEIGFSAAVRLGSLRSSIDTIPADNEHQLNMVLQLIRCVGVKAAVSPRFVECARAFKEGIGGEHATTSELQSVAYADAYTRYYLPFFLRYPHMLENLLLNMLFRSNFPFGPLLLSPEAPQPTREYALLVTEFALIKGFLIGVAGYHKEAFSFEHVVETVQVIVKNFEHHPRFLSHSLELLTSNGLNDARGLTMLLRN